MDFAIQGGIKPMVALLNGTDFQKQHALSMLFCLIKRNAAHGDAIVGNGAIPLLIRLLSGTDE